MKRGVTLADLDPRVRAQVVKVAHLAAQKARIAHAIAKVDQEQVGRKAAKVPGWKALPRPPSKGEETFALHCRAKLPVWYPQPLREHVFADGRKWRFDFAWVAWMLAVEIEGLTRQGSRHQRAKGFMADCRKYNRATELGWRVLRYTPHQVRSGEAIAQVWRTLEALEQAREAADPQGLTQRRLVIREMAAARV